jgi:hypothetical protein
VKSKGSLVARLVVVDLEALELLVAPCRVVAQRVFRRYLKQELSLGLFLGLGVGIFSINRFVGRLLRSG